jgi:hypothetical protein
VTEPSDKIKEYLEPLSDYELITNLKCLIMFIKMFNEGIFGMNDRYEDGLPEPPGSQSKSDCINLFKKDFLIRTRSHKYGPKFGFISLEAKKLYTKLESLKILEILENSKKEKNFSLDFFYNEINNLLPVEINFYSVLVCKEGDKINEYVNVIKKVNETESEITLEIELTCKCNNCFNYIHTIKVTDYINNTKIYCEKCGFKFPLINGLKISR